LSAILDAQLFPTFMRPNSWAPFSWLLRPNFYTTLWTLKVNFWVKKLGAVVLNYLYIQEIDPKFYFLPSSHSTNQFIIPKLSFWSPVRIEPFAGPKLSF
jgi:hypothetical protein